MIIDYTITIGNMLEATTIVVGGFIVLLTMRSDIGGLKATDLVRSVQITSIEIELKKIAEVLTKQAVLDTRLAAAEQDIRDIQRGRGLILEDARA